MPSRGTEKTDLRNNLLNLVDRKIIEEFALTNHRQDPGKDGLKETERLLL